MTRPDYGAALPPSHRLMSQAYTENGKGRVRSSEPRQELRCLLWPPMPGAENSPLASGGVHVDFGCSAHDHTCPGLRQEMDKVISERVIVIDEQDSGAAWGHGGQIIATIFTRSSG